MRQAWSVVAIAACSGGGGDSGTCKVDIVASASYGSAGISVLIPATLDATSSCPGLATGYFAIAAGTHLEQMFPMPPPAEGTAVPLDDTSSYGSGCSAQWTTRFDGAMYSLAGTLAVAGIATSVIDVSAGCAPLAPACLRHWTTTLAADGTAGAWTLASSSAGCNDSPTQPDPFVNKTPVMRGSGWVGAGTSFTLGTYFMAGSAYVGAVLDGTRMVAVTATDRGDGGLDLDVVSD